MLNLFYHLFHHPSMLLFLAHKIHFNNLLYLKDYSKNNVPLECQKSWAFPWIHQPITTWLFYFCAFISMKKIGNVPFLILS